MQNDRIKALLDLCVCPVDKSELSVEGNWLISKNGRKYPLVFDVPVFLSDELGHMTWWSENSLKTAKEIANGNMKYSKHLWDGDGVHPYVKNMIAATNGILYKNLIDNLDEYPIPGFPLENGNGKLLLDIGCNWGRWSISAARQSFNAVGIDPSLDAILVGREIANKMDLKILHLVGDARNLPFRKETFDTVFSYSVIQHFSKTDAKYALSEINYVLKPEGVSKIQMPNKLGIRSFYHQLRRGFNEGQNFDVRYYFPGELKKIFLEQFGIVKFEIDGFFGLGIQKDDMRFMNTKNRVIIQMSELFKKIAKIFRPLLLFADSLYILSRKR